jgi:hypothetical protein
MRPHAHFATIAFLVVFSAFSCGCETTAKNYDLSAIPPFSAYINKEVSLTRDVLLIASLGSRDAHHNFEPLPLDDATTSFQICYKEDPEAHNLEPSQYHRTLLLRAGTSIRVEGALLWSHRQPLRAISHTEGLYSNVLVTPNSPGWPNQIRAFFSHSVCPPLMQFEDEKGKIRPAPWEPLDTPAERFISWPSKEYLVQGQ